MTIRSTAQVFVSCLGLCLPCAGAVVSWQDWQFTTEANPAAATVFTNQLGTPLATIEVGFMGSGWFPSFPGFGTQRGLWDLGGQDPLDSATRGRVSLSIPNPPPSMGSTTDLALRIVQFMDGQLYTGDLTFSLGGASFTGRTNVEVIPPSQGGGRWVEDSYQWHLASSPSPISLVITGAVGGTFLDRIRVEVSGPPSPITITSVTKSNGLMLLTWTGGQPPYQLLGTERLQTNAVWQAVGPQLSGTNAQVPINTSVEFIRVRGSN